MRSRLMLLPALSTAMATILIGCSPDTSTDSSGPIGSAPVTAESTAGAEPAPECAAEPTLEALDINSLPSISLDTKMSELDLCDSRIVTGIAADLAYLNSVHTADVGFDSDEIAVKVGRGTCTLLERAIEKGHSVRNAKLMLLTEYDGAGVYTHRQNAAIVGAAVGAFCPVYRTK